MVLTIKKAFRLVHFGLYLARLGESQDHRTLATRALQFRYSIIMFIIDTDSIYQNMLGNTCCIL